MIVTSGGNQRAHLPHPYHCHDLQARLAATGTTRELLWVGVADGLDAKIAARTNVPFRAITAGRLRRSPSPRELARNIADAFRTRWVSRKP